jgi:exosortase/archaeosortase family protein
MDFTLKKIPQNVKVFFGRGLILLVAWKLLYLLLLEPLQFPDEPLTRLIVFSTTKTLSIFQPGVFFAGHEIFTYNGRKIIGILNPCNGLEVMVLYSGFIIAMPTLVKSFKRKLLFILAGITGIIILNIIRCTTLSLIAFQYPQIFEFSHKYLFNLLVYSSMILAWSYYCNNKKYVL